MKHTSDGNDASRSADIASVEPRRVAGLVLVKHLWGSDLYQQAHQRRPTRTPKSKRKLVHQLDVLWGKPHRQPRR